LATYTVWPSGESRTPIGAVPIESGTASIWEAPVAW
jgi:hypothetical protein